jgi:dihydrofolate synthase/folylpolyglutamate synthase
MNYSETLDYLFSQLPMFQRIGKTAFKADLKTTTQLMEMLGNPERKLKTIHIAGTNGKGSVAHLISSVLQEQGYKTGLYTSPHLVDFRERIKLNGELCSEDFVVDFVEKYREKFEELKPSFFEMTVAMAFDYFVEQEVDIAVVEVGMGGRLDSTNVLLPELSVITNIGFDHTAFLGNTIAEIAREKAGIIKNETPVVVGKCNDEVHNVMLEVSKKLAAPIRFVDDYSLRVPRSGLHGAYQRENEQTAFLALQLLAENGWEITVEGLKRGFENVVANTSFQGRWQILSENPLTVCDAGHNEDGLKAAMKEVEKTPHQQLHIVLGMVSDKEIGKMLDLLPLEAVYYFAKANIPRGLDAQELERQAKSKALSGNCYASVQEAFFAAQQKAAKEDLIFIGGSFFTVAEVLAIIR